MDSRIAKIANELRDLLSRKNEDYAPGTEFSNFEEAAKFACIEPLDVMLAQLGIKFTRLAGLTKPDATPNFESYRDNLLDLAGYAIITVAYLDSLSDMNDRVVVPLYPDEEDYDY